MADRQPINIDLAQGLVEVGGVNIATAVSALHIRSSPHAGTTVTFSMHVDRLDLVTDPDNQNPPRVDAATHQALLALGWNPPASTPVATLTQEKSTEFCVDLFRIEWPDGRVALVFQQPESAADLATKIATLP